VHDDSAVRTHSPLRLAAWYVRCVPRPEGTQIEGTAAVAHTHTHTHKLPSWEPQPAHLDASRRLRRPSVSSRACTGSAVGRYIKWWFKLPYSKSVVLIPSWELLGAGNLSDKLGASWEPVIGSNAGARSLGAPGSLGAPKKIAWELLGAWEPPPK